MTSPSRLSENLISVFQDLGVTVIRQCVDTHGLAELSRAIEEDIRSPGPFYHGYKSEEGSGRFHGNLRLWEHDSTFRKFCFSSPLPQIAAGFLESQKVNLLYAQ